MKIKTYKRKGKAMTGPQYKRKLWKQKMKARSESYGDKCFKCGQSGHWANKCKGMNFLLGFAGVPHDTPWHVCATIFLFSHKK